MVKNVPKQNFTKKYKNLLINTTNKHGKSISNDRKKINNSKRKRRSQSRSLKRHIKEKKNYENCETEIFSNNTRNKKIEEIIDKYHNVLSSLRESDPATYKRLNNSTSLSTDKHKKVQKVLLFLVANCI